MRSNLLKLDQFISVAQAAARLGVSRQAVYNMIARNELRAFDVGSHARLVASEVEEVAARRPVIERWQCAGCGRVVSRRYTFCPRCGRRLAGSNLIHRRGRGEE